MRKAILGGALLLILAVGAASVASATPKTAAPEKMQTAAGTVSKLQAADHAVVVSLADGSTMRFVWTADTKINGTLSQGARVTVRYTSLPDGQNLAHQISVGR